MKRLLILARWPFGVVITAFTYIWRTTPVQRAEMAGTWASDRPPPIPPGIDPTGVQEPSDGSGALMHRRYRIRLRGVDTSPEELMAGISADPDVVTPGHLAKFEKVRGAKGHLAVNDEFRVKMPGPWDGPVRVAEVSPRHFRFVTLDGHLEAGQIEWAAGREGDTLEFRVESWSAPGDRASNALHHHLPMAKEVQLHMWTSVLERVCRRAGGRRTGPIDIRTWIVEDVN